MAVLEKTFFLLSLAICLYCAQAQRSPSEPDHEGDPLNTKYLVVLPKVLIGGSSEVVCITLTKMTAPINFNLELTLEDAVVFEMEYFMEFPYACLDLLVPNIATSTATVVLSISGRSAYLDEMALPIIVDSKNLTIEKSKRMTFVETDKPIYKPGQTVKFRVLTVDGDLRPDSSKVDKIWVETPSGIRIAQWLAVEANQGLISLELPMTSDPMLGTWKIFVEHNGDRTYSNFDIDEYVLPKFEVTFDGPSYVLVNETQLEYTVCGRYTYGQPVPGDVEATLVPVVAYSVHDIEPISIESVSTGPDGCAMIVFDISEWDLTRNYYSIHDAKLRIAASFTERVTGVTIDEEDESCKITYNMFQLEFTGNTEYKEGLPFNGEVSLTMPDGSPAAGKEVHIQKVYGGEFSVDVVTDTFGKATFELPAIGREAVMLEATVAGVSTERQRARFTVTAQSAQLSLKSHFSPSNTFLKISDPLDSFSLGDDIQLKILHTGSEALTTRDFKVLFISNGNIIRPTNRYDTESIDEGMEYKQLVLTFTATKEMSPLTKIVVYFIQDGEVVADSSSFLVAQTFDNQVQISFSSSEEKPGENTQLLVSASPNSLCGVGIVDKSVYLLGGGSNNIQEKQVSQFLKQFELDERSGINSDRCNGGQSHHDWGWRMYRPTPTAQDAAASFNKAGFSFLTNLNLETAPCSERRYRTHFDDQPMPMFMDMDSDPRLDSADNGIPPSPPNQPAKEAPRLRSYFPETWLWDLVLIQESTLASVDLTVPDTVTEWIGNGFCISETDGIGISSTSSLQAFQPFFLSYTLPYSVIRGETFPVKVIVFNYMTDCLVIELVLSESENFTLAEHEEQTKQLCVCGSQSASVEFNIIPTVIGSMPIEVTAMSVTDELATCGNSLVMTLSNADDAIRREILVEAEGIEQEVTKSDMFCPSDSPDGFTWTLDLQPPADVVPDTAWAKVSLSGDLMGPALSNLQNLLQVPYGCGEQNMLTFVPNVLAMEYMTATNQLTPEIEKEAIDNMKLGYQREFNYRHDDGSFSAFGKSDDSGSTWLTAYVIRSFYQASQFIDVDFEDLQRSVDWLKGLQKVSGCFLSVGKLCHKDMLGGINNDLTLSAYVVISLLEAGEDPSDDSITAGLECLEDQVDSIQDTYALSQIAYALALGNSNKVTDVLDTLEEMAIYEDGGKHWASNRATTGTASHYSPSSADVEMTSYMLMTYMVLYPSSEIVVQGLPVSRWLVQRRNSRGGFGSTQDTVVGLTALARFAEYTVDGDLNILLSVESSQVQEDWGTNQELMATNVNRLVLQQLYLKNIPTTLTFQGTGAGCALLQVSTFYNTYPEEAELPEFELSVTIGEQAFVRCSEFFVHVCASYTSEDGASNMAVIDFRLQSGYVASKDSLDALKKEEPTLKRYEMDGKSVLFYFDEIQLQPTCISFTMLRDILVKDTKPSFVTVYDYYKTDVKKTVTYSLECSSETGLPLLPTTRKWGSLTAIDMERLPGPILACPVCEDELPSDFLNKFCNSDHVFTFRVRVRQTNRVKLLNDYISGEVTLNQYVSYYLAEDCDCELLESGKYILFTKSESVDLEEQTLILSESSLIIPYKRKYLAEFENPDCPVS